MGGCDDDRKILNVSSITAEQQNGSVAYGFHRSLGAGFGDVLEGSSLASTTKFGFILNSIGEGGQK